MSNTKLEYCPVCERTTSFYHVDSEFWECEECGHRQYNDDDDDEEEDEDKGI